MKNKLLIRGTKNQSEITNYAGDNTGDTLKSAIRTVKPDALISFGAGTDNAEDYNIETISYGMGSNGAVYSNKDNFVTNNDLADIYKKQLTKK